MFVLVVCLSGCGRESQRSPAPARSAPVPRLVGGINTWTGSLCLTFDRGRVACSGQLAIPSQELEAPHALTEIVGLPRVRSVSLSQLARQACALDLDGEAWCWGDNRGGALGRGSVGPSEAAPTAFLPPARVRGVPEVIAIEGATDAFCALTADGGVLCWGSNVDGVAWPGGSAADVPTPRRVDGVPAVVGIQAGQAQMCGRSAAGAIWCWGDLGRGDDRGPRRVVATGARRFVPQPFPGSVCFVAGDGDGAQRCVSELGADSIPGDRAGSRRGSP
ncbi:MAG: hypothetical protein H6708_17425 [Kofleriaceae bacterium]|nr:hypothetical protein [Kofleriaceae bacterium]